MTKKRLFTLPAAAILTFALLITTAASAFAAAPSIRKTDYEGRGRVDVDFNKDVKYNKSTKVTVKDSTGKAYTATIIDKDEDDLEFKIKNYKEGENYSFTISGVKIKGTSKYGKVSGTVAIPAAKKTTVSKSKAIAAAVAHAQNTLKVTNIRDKDAEKETYRGTASWEVEFEGKMNGKWYDFEYNVDRANGSILNFVYEID